MKKLKSLLLLLTVLTLVFATVFSLAACKKKSNDSEPAAPVAQSLTVSYDGDEVVLSADEATVQAIKGKITVVINMSDGTSNATTDYSVEDFNAEIVNTVQSVTIKSGQLEKAIPVKIVSQSGSDQPVVTGISVAIKNGDSVLELASANATVAAIKAGITVTTVMSEGQGQVVTDVTIEHFDASVKNTVQSVTIRYGTHTATISVKVVENAPVATGIKVTINGGGKFVEIFSSDATEDAIRAKITVKKVMSDGELQPTDYSIVGFDASKVDQKQTVKIQVGELKEDLVVLVTDDTPMLDRIIVEIKGGGARVEIPASNASEAVLRSLIVVTAEYDNGSSEVVTDYSVDNFSATTIGTEYGVTIRYGESSKRIDVIILEGAVTPVAIDISVEINGGAEVVEIEQATESAIKAAITVKKVMSVGEPEEITDYTIENFDATVVGTIQSVTIRYGTYSKPVDVKIVSGAVIPTVTGITAQVKVGTVVELEADNATVAAIKAAITVKKVMSVGEPEEISDYTIEDFVATTLDVQQSVTIRYGTHTATVNVIVNSPAVPEFAISIIVNNNAQNAVVLTKNTNATSGAKEEYTGSVTLNVGDKVKIVDTDNKEYTNYENGLDFTGTAIGNGVHVFYVKLYEDGGHEIYVDDSAVVVPDPSFQVTMKVDGVDYPRNFVRNEENQAKYEYKLLNVVLEKDAVVTLYIDGQAVSNYADEEAFNGVVPVYSRYDFYVSRDEIVVYRTNIVTLQIGAQQAVEMTAGQGGAYTMSVELAVGDSVTVMFNGVEVETYAVSYFDGTATIAGQYTFSVTAESISVEIPYVAYIAYGDSQTGTFEHAALSDDERETLADKFMIVVELNPADTIAVTNSMGQTISEYAAGSSITGTATLKGTYTIYVLLYKDGSAKIMVAEPATVKVELQIGSGEKKAFGVSTEDATKLVLKVRLEENDTVKIYVDDVESSAYVVGCAFNGTATLQGNYEFTYDTTTEKISVVIPYYVYLDVTGATPADAQHAVLTEEELTAEDKTAEVLAKYKAVVTLNLGDRIAVSDSKENTFVGAAGNVWTTAAPLAGEYTIYVKIYEDSNEICVALPAIESVVVTIGSYEGQLRLDGGKYVATAASIAEEDIGETLVVSVNGQEVSYNNPFVVSLDGKHDITVEIDATGKVSVSVKEPYYVYVKVGTGNQVRLSPSKTIPVGCVAQYQITQRLTIGDTIVLTDSENRTFTTYEEGSPFKGVVKLAGDHTIYVKQYEDGTHKIYVSIPQVATVQAKFGAQTIDLVVNDNNEDETVYEYMALAANMAKDDELSIWLNGVEVSYGDAFEARLSGIHQIYVKINKTTYAVEVIVGEPYYVYVSVDSGDKVALQEYVYGAGEEVPQDLKQEFRLTATYAVGKVLAFSDSKGENLTYFVATGGATVFNGTVGIPGEYTFYVRIYEEGYTIFVTVPKMQATISVDGGTAQKFSSNPDKEGEFMITNVAIEGGKSVAITLNGTANSDYDEKCGFNGTAAYNGTYDFYIREDGTIWVESHPYVYMKVDETMTSIENKKVVHGAANPNEDTRVQIQYSVTNQQLTAGQTVAFVYSDGTPVPNVEMENKFTGVAAFTGKYSFYLKYYDGVKDGQTEASKWTGLYCVSPSITISSVKISVDGGTTKRALTKDATKDEYYIKGVALEAGQSVIVYINDQPACHYAPDCKFNGIAAYSGKYDFYVSLEQIWVDGLYLVKVGDGADAKYYTLSEVELTASEATYLKHQYKVSVLLNAGETVQIVNLKGEAVGEFESGCGFNGTAPIKEEYTFYFKIRTSGAMETWVARADHDERGIDVEINEGDEIVLIGAQATEANIKAAITVSIRYSDGTSETKTSYTITGFAPATYSKQTITIKYVTANNGTLEKELEVTVQQPKVTAISVSNENVSLPGAKATEAGLKEAITVTATLNDGSAPQAVTTYLVTFEDELTAAGDSTKATISVTIGGATVTKDITVTKVAASVLSIAVSGDTQANLTFVGAKATADAVKSKITVVATMNDGTTPTVTNDIVVDAIATDNYSVAGQVIGISYTAGGTASKTITVYVTEPSIATVHVAITDGGTISLVETMATESAVKALLTVTAVNDDDTQASGFAVSLKVKDGDNWIAFPAKLSPDKISQTYTIKAVVAGIESEETINVTVEKLALTRIEVSSKTGVATPVVLIGANATSDGLKAKIDVRAFYNDGTDELVDGYTVGTIDTSKTEAQDVTITYGGKNDTISVQISSATITAITNVVAVADNGSAISLVESQATEANIKALLKVSATMSDLSNVDKLADADYELVVTGAAGIELPAVGTYTIQAKCGENVSTQTITLTVIAKVATGITVTPNTLTFEGANATDAAIKDAIEVVVNYNDGTSSQPVAKADYTVTAINAASHTTQYLTVTHTASNKTAQLTVTVQAPTATGAIEVSITSGASVITLAGQNATKANILAAITVKQIMSDGSKQTVENVQTVCDVENFQADNTEEQTVRITMGSAIAYVKVQVVAATVQSISVAANIGTIELVGAGKTAEDVAAAITAKGGVTAHYNDNTTQTLAYGQDGYTLSGFNAQTYNSEQNVAIKYTGCADVTIQVKVVFGVTINAEGSNVSVNMTAGVAGTGVLYQATATITLADDDVVSFTDNNEVAYSTYESHTAFTGVAAMAGSYTFKFTLTASGATIEATATPYKGLVIVGENVYVVNTVQATSDTTVSVQYKTDVTLAKGTTGVAVKMTGETSVTFENRSAFNPAPRTGTYTFYVKKMKAGGINIWVTVPDKVATLTVKGSDDTVKQTIAMTKALEKDEYIAISVQLAVGDTISVVVDDVTLAYKSSSNLKGAATTAGYYDIYAQDAGSSIGVYVSTVNSKEHFLVYLDCSYRWTNVNCHAYDGAAANTQWPGYSMETSGRYSKVMMNVGDHSKLIFTGDEGSERKRSIKITLPATAVNGAILVWANNESWVKTEDGYCVEGAWK